MLDDLLARVAGVPVGVESSDSAQPLPNDSAPPTRTTRWLIHFLDRGPLEVWFSPAADHAEVMVSYPDAVAAEPVPERSSTRQATPQERSELLALVAAIFADDRDEDRREAADLALRHPDGALTCYRAIAVERGITLAHPLPRIALAASVPTVAGCKTCRHRKQPGRADPGYCGGGRDDLPLAYGENHPLRRLPDDHGASCASYTSFKEMTP